MSGSDGRRTRPASDAPRVVPLALGMLALVVVGAPLVFALWTAINHLLYGDVAAVRWAVALPALAGFVVLLSVLPRVLRRWEGEPTRPTPDAGAQTSPRPHVDPEEKP